MKQGFLAVAFIFLAACAGPDALGPAEKGPAGPAVGIRPPSLAVQFESAGDITVTSDSDCPVTGSSFICTFTFQNVPADSYALSIYGYWNFTYQCVHSKTGRTNKRYPPTQVSLLTNLAESNLSPTAGGEFTRTSLSVAAPALPTDLCDGTGPFTVESLIGQPVPTGWLIIFYNPDFSEYAQLYNYAL